MFEDTGRPESHLGFRSLRKGGLELVEQQLIRIAACVVA
jgi:hypothetical protein